MAKKTDPNQLFILTANDLSSGDVVFWSDRSEWTKSLDRAYLLGHDETEAMNEIGRLSENANEVVGIYLTPVNKEADLITPVELRERRRVTGPSIAYGAPSFSHDLAA